MHKLCIVVHGGESSLLLIITYLFKQTFSGINRLWTEQKMNPGGIVCFSAKKDVDNWQTTLQYWKCGINSTMDWLTATQ